MLLAGRNAIVTGGAAGSGQAACERLAAERVRVVICDIDIERELELQASLRSQGANTWSASCEVGSIASVDMMVAQAIELADRIDIPVNHAGVTRRIGLLDTDEESWDWIQAINTKELCFCLQRVVAHMHENGGSVPRRFMAPADIAGAELFLCSALPRNITGPSINVDGGTMWN